MGVVFFVKESFPLIKESIEFFTIIILLISDLCRVFLDVWAKVAQTSKYT